MSEQPLKNQFWLASVDQYGNATLVDGAHQDREGVERAATLIKRMGLANGRRFAIAEILLSELTGQHKPVDEEAIGTLRDDDDREEIAAGDYRYYAPP